MKLDLPAKKKKKKKKKKRSLAVPSWAGFAVHLAVKLRNISYLIW
jgi:hypothetical protein